MTRDRRGFTYALEAVRSMTAWDIDEIANELATLNAAASAQQKKVDGLSASLAAARAQVIAQRQVQAILDIDAQRLAHAYMLLVQQHLQLESAQLRTVLGERDATYTRLIEARKFADSLDRDKESAADEHDQKMVKQGYQQSDDNWLQRLHWRKSQ
jgi:hypothetical protein